MAPIYEGFNLGAMGAPDAVAQQFINMVGTIMAISRVGPGLPVPADGARPGWSHECAKCSGRAPGVLGSKRAWESTAAWVHQLVVSCSSAALALGTMSADAPHHPGQCAALLTAV